MAKITKKEYEARKQEIQSKIDNITRILQQLKEKYSNNIEQYDKDYAENTDYWNDMHDLQDDYEKQMEELEDEWETRSWTYSDWQEHHLVINNID